MSESTEVQDFKRWIRGLTFLQFARVFGVLWGEEQKTFIPWHWWPGVRGYAGQRDMLEAMATAEILWLSKGRQLAASEAAGLYAIYLGFTDPRSLSMWFSKDGPAANAALHERVARKLDGLVEFCRQPDGKEWPWFGADGTPVFWRYGRDGKFNDKYIEFADGAMCEAHSSEDSGSASRSPRLIIFDEMRYYERNQAKEIWSSFIGGLRPPRQLFGISTNAPGTWCSDMTKKIWGGGMSSARFLFMPADIELKPDGTPRWDAAGEYRKKKLEQYDGVEATLKVMHPMEPEDMFASNEGLVIGSLNKERHLRRIPLTWDSWKEFHIIYDDGHTKEHPAAAAFCQYDTRTDFLYVFDEVFLRAADFPVIAQSLVTCLQQWRDRDAPEPETFGDVKGKTGTRDVGEVMYEETDLLGTPLSFSGVDKADKAGSLRLLQSRFFHDKICYDPRCENLWKQLEGWIYDKKGEPSEYEDEAGDLGRYECNRIRKGGAPPREETTLEREIRRQRAMARRSAMVTSGSGGWQAGLAGVR